MLCGSCGSNVPAGARFCPSCGQPLQAAQVAAEERRIVTVLFGDLVGFTTLAEHMDPEALKRLIDSCFEKMVAVVNEFGGRVDKILGDGILALFGAPVAHEDDPERAVRAALRMQETLAEHVASNDLTGTEAVRMRIGINTGEVLVGTLAGTDYTAMGDVVNLASRLQTAAPPGGVVVGAATHALTSHTFQFEPQGELQAKGREQAVEAWQALAPTAPPGAARRQRREVRFVGRDAEQSITHGAVDLVLTHGRGLLLHLTGDSGIGKSRLVDEVIAHLRSRSTDVTVLEGACVPYGESNVWFPIATALSNHLGLDPAMPADEVRAEARRRTTALLQHVDPSNREQFVEVFCHLLGLPSAIDRLEPAGARSAVHHAVAQVIEARSQEGPIVLSIDDLHWADPTLIDLLKAVVGSLGRHPFVLLTATRPGFDLEWPPRVDRGTVVSLWLQPLSRDETFALAAALLDDNDVDPARLAALHDRSGGNPLFLVELAALTRAGGSGELPDSLRTLVAARLDQLSVAQRQVVENAAVMGTSGSIVALERFAEALGQPEPTTAIDELDELGLLQVDGNRWEFASESVRDAAYQTLTKSARATRHLGVARSLAMNNGNPDDLAHHTASAAELVNEIGALDGLPTDLGARAIQMLADAADRAIDSGSLRAAVRNATRAIDLSHDAEPDSPVLAQLRIVRATAATDQRQFDAAIADIDAVQATAERTGNQVMLAEAHRLRGLLANVSGRIDVARSELGTAVDLLRSTDRIDLLANALRLRGFIEMFTGSLADASWFLGEAEDLFRSLGDERGLAYVEQHRAWVSFQSGDLAQARQRLNNAASTLGRYGDRNGVGWAFGLLAFVEFFERHFDQAETLAKVVQREAELRGDEWAAAMMDTLLANLRLWQGELDDAHAFAEQARARCRRLNDQFGLVQALAPLVRVQVAQGRLAAAQRSIEELGALADTGRHGPFPMLAAAGAAMHRGSGATAVAIAQRATEAMRANGSSPYEASAIIALGFAQQGRIDDALAAIEDVMATRLDHPFVRAAAALCYALAGQPEKAIEHAQAVGSMSGATYLDEVFAHVAAAGAAAQQGNATHVQTEAEAAVQRAAAVGDVVATAFAAAAFRALTGHDHAAFDRTYLTDGWATVVRGLTPHQ